EKLVRAGRRELGRDLTRGAGERPARRRQGGEIAVRRDPARVADEDVEVRVALSREPADLRAEDVAAVRRQVLETARLGLALAVREVVDLAVEHALEPRLGAEGDDVAELQAPGRALAIEHVDLGGAELIERGRAIDRLVEEYVVRLAQAEMDGCSGAM